MPDGPKRRTPAQGLRPPLGVPVEPAAATDTAATIRLIARQQRDTAQDVSKSLDRVDGLRAELNGRIDQLDGKVDELAVGAARVEGAVSVLVEELRQDRVERSEIRVSVAQATIEVEKTGEVAKINEAVAVRSDRRQFWLKGIAILGPIAATLATLLASRC